VSSPVLAFDLGGTRLKAGLVHLDEARVEAFAVTPSAPTAAEALERVAALGASLLRDRSCRAVGLCVPGIVAARSIEALPGKLDGIVGVDLVDWLEKRFAVPAVLANDALAYGMGEAACGAARGHERAVVVTIGTGIGVSVLQDGRPVTPGPLGGGILGGQIPIDDGTRGPRDTNGKRGTIEALCAGRRIVSLAQDFASIPEVYAAAAAGDQRATRALDVYRRDLARGLAALAHAHTPSIVVLGGGPLPPDNPVLPGLATLVDDWLWPGYAVTLAAAARGDEAPLLGLAVRASP
jgi:predicted NBD/HSP70 family sugar kinase